MECAICTELANAIVFSTAGRTAMQQIIMGFQYVLNFNRMKHGSVPCAHRMINNIPALYSIWLLKTSARYGEALEDVVILDFNILYLK